MFCKNCGKELDDDAKFCPGCGTLSSAEVSAESPVTPEPAPTKKSPKWLIPAIAAAVAVVILVALLGGAFASPSVRLGKALAKSGGAFAAAMDKTGLNDVSDLLVAKDFTQELSFWLDEADGASELAGLGIRITTDSSMTDRVVGMDVTPYLGSADLMKLQMKFDNDKIYLGSPELTKDSFFMINTTTIGDTLARLMYEDQLRGISFNMFDLAAQMEEMQTPSEEAQEALEAACLEFTQSVEVTKADKITLEVNGQDLKCAAYHVLITEAAMDQLLYAVEDAYKTVDATRAYTEMLRSMGLPDEVIDEMEYAMGDSAAETDAYFQELHSVVKGLGDVELDLYENKGYVVAAVYADTINDTDVEVVLNVGGGKNYADDISLRIVVDGEVLNITSSGNHTGENGQFTDKTVFATDEDGTLATMELDYTPKAEADNFRWSVSADETTVSAAGQVTFQKDSLAILLDKITFDDMATMGMEYRLSGYQGDRIPTDTCMALDEMTEEELYSALEDLGNNAVAWLMDLMEQFPDLFYYMY